MKFLIFFSIYFEPDTNNDTTEKEALEEENEMNAGWSVLLKYFEACGGYFVMFSIFFVVFLFASIRLFTSVWLKIWLDEGDGSQIERNFNDTENNQISVNDLEVRGNIADNPKVVEIRYLSRTFQSF